MNTGLVKDYMLVRDINNRDSLMKFLAETLGYCLCGAGEEGIKFLYRILSLAQNCTRSKRCTIFCCRHERRGKNMVKR